MQYICKKSRYIFLKINIPVLRGYICGYKYSNLVYLPAQIYHGHIPTKASSFVSRKSAREARPEFVSDEVVFCEK